MKRLWLVALLGCTHSSAVKLDAQEDIHLAQQAKLQEHDTETLTKGPVDKISDRTVQDLAVIAQAPDGSITVARVTAAHPLKLAAGSKITGTIPLQHLEQKTAEHQAAAVDTKTNDSCEDVGLDLTKKEIVHKEDDESTSWWPPLWLWLAGAAAIGALGFVAWKLKPPWLTAAIAVCKRL